MSYLHDNGQPDQGGQSIMTQFRDGRTIPDGGDGGNMPADTLFVLLPLLIILTTLLFILFLVLVCALLLRRRRGIMLRDSDGPVDMSREDFLDGDGGFDGLESRWLESVSDSVRQAYLRARGS